MLIILFITQHGWAKNTITQVKLSSNFGDIIGQQLTGNVSIDANRSDIQLDHPSGNFTIAAKYGTVTILEDKNRQFDLDIKGKKTNVVFIEPVLSLSYIKFPLNYSQLTRKISIDTLLVDISSISSALDFFVSPFLSSYLYHK